MEPYLKVRRCLLDRWRGFHLRPQPSVPTTFPSGPSSAGVQTARLSELPVRGPVTTGDSGVSADRRPPRRRSRSRSRPFSASAPGGTRFELDETQGCSSSDGTPVFEAAFTSPPPHPRDRVEPDLSVGPPGLSRSRAGLEGAGENRVALARGEGLTQPEPAESGSVRRPQGASRTQGGRAAASGGLPVRRRPRAPETGPTPLPTPTPRGVSSKSLRRSPAGLQGSAGDPRLVQNK